MSTELDIIRKPIEAELEQFIELFNSALSTPEGLLSEVLNHIKQRAGKRMRPILILLVSKAFGDITNVSQYAAVGLELLHTASLVHDDVVDESGERRGQASVNALYDNKVAVLVGDFILSTALQSISKTKRHDVVNYLSELGRTLSAGEILQLSNINREDISEEVYYEVIKQKTAALFEACAGIGALSAETADKTVEKAKQFGQDLGIAFQIRDDIFDYFEEKNVGKPTGADLSEGKITLPLIYALRKADQKYVDLALKAKKLQATKDEIQLLVDFAKANGGIEYAQQKMREYKDSAMRFIDENVQKSDIAEALRGYVDYVVGRDI